MLLFQSPYCALLCQYEPSVEKKVCRFPSSCINTVTQETPVQTRFRQSGSPGNGQSRLFPPVQKAFVLFFANLGKTCIFWGSFLKHVTTVEYNKLNIRRYEMGFFFSILLLIPGSVMANFLLGKIFQDIPLKCSTIGIKYLR